MNGMKSFAQVREAVTADDAGKWDATARRQDIRLKDGKLAFPMDTIGEHWEHLAPTTWAVSQLCTRLGIPAGYFRKCPTVLQDVQANYWLRAGSERNAERTVARRSNGGQEMNGANGHPSQDDPFGEPESGNGCEPMDCCQNGQEQWLLRARGGTLRAVLSERYSPLDNATLMECLAPLLHSRYRVDWFGLSDESLHLRIIDPERAREVLPNDKLSIGIHLANSEVGLRSVTVDALVYRLVCENGLIRLVKGKSLLKKRHVHLSETRFVAALEEALEGAFATAEGFLEQMRQTARQPVRDVEGTIKRLSERWNLTDATREAVKDALRREPAPLQETLYGVVNAFTSAAQRLPDEQRYDLEVLAGRLADHGVAAYAAHHESEPDIRPQLVPDAVALENGADQNGNARSIFQLAQEMFEAEVVSAEAVRP
jgi:Domain of unknown function (DUF932)